MVGIAKAQAIVNANKMSIPIGRKQTDLSCSEKCGQRASMNPSPRRHEMFVVVKIFSALIYCACREIEAASL